MTAQECVLLGNQLLKVGRVQEAIKSYRQAVDLNPNLSWAYQNLGEIYRVQHEWEEAIAAYRQSIAVQPSSIASYVGLGKALMKLDRWQDAAIAYQKATELNPSSFESYHHLGEALAQLQQWPEAVQAYQHATQLNQNSALTYHYLGDALVECQQWEEAIECYLNVFLSYQELQPIDPLLKQAYKRIVEIKKSRPLPEAIEIYQQITQQQPDWLMAHVDLGDLYAQQGDLTAAISAYQAASYQKGLKSSQDGANNNTAPLFKGGWGDQNAGYSSENFCNQSNSTLRQPHFLIIGIGKGGTSSLYHYLVNHPQILPALKKEVFFFNQNLSYGLDWYLAHFSPIPKDANLLTGEATPWYLVSFNAEQEVARLFPKIKLIVLLRNPVLRAFSQYQMRVEFEKETRTFLDVITSEMAAINRLSHPTLTDTEYWHREKGDLLFGLYVYFLEKWMAVFPREQILILQSEDFYAHPAATLTQVFDFLGVPDYPLPAYPNYNPGSYSPMTEDLRQILADFFRPHNQRLEAYLGMKFNWDE
jgi:tetratricopeptide (TPR) repeat protein